MARMTNDEIRATEGEDFAVIDNNYSDRQVEVAIAARAGKAAEAVEELKEEIEELKNNPDVVDIVDAYTDLQAYDKSKLTDKDVLRVLNDETHDGNSTYYRYSKATNSFTYIGSSKTYDVFTGTDGTVAGAKGLVPAPATTDAGKFLKADGTWADGGAQSDWAENDSTDPAYIQNRPFYEDVITSEIPQGETVEAGTTPDSGYVWLVEQVLSYDLSEVLSGEDGDTVYMDITYSVNGTPKTDGAEFTLTIENNEAQLDAVAPTGNRWRGAYAMESSGNTTFRFPVSTSDSSATVYITSVKYTKVKKLNGKYLPVDGDTIIVNQDGKLEGKGSGGLPETTTFWGQTANNGVVEGDMHFGPSSSIGGDIVHYSAAGDNSYMEITQGQGNRRQFIRVYRDGSAGQADDIGTLGGMTLRQYFGSNTPLAVLIRGVETPEQQYDAANKQYVDTQTATLTDTEFNNLWEVA